jgi:nucleotide-binding universal stress UspA family protein
VATIGLSIGAVSPNLFTMILVMALITTMAMPPTLRWALVRLPISKDEKQRLEREEMDAKGFVPRLERLLIAADESANGKFAARIGGIIASVNAMPTTVIHIATDKKNRKAAAIAEKEKAKETAETVLGIARRSELAKNADGQTIAEGDVTTMVERTPKSKAIAEEAKKGYDLLIIGLEKTVARRNEFHDDVATLAAGFEGPIVVVDARDIHREEPLQGRFNILVPVNGTEMSRRAAEIGIAMARLTKAPLVALYVAPRGKADEKRSRRYEEAILKDIVALADTHQVEIRTAVRADVAPEEAILKEAARRRHNLIVMGVGRRPGKKLFFGDTAAALMAKSKCSLEFLAS